MRKDSDSDRQPNEAGIRVAGIVSSTLRLCLPGRVVWGSQPPHTRWRHTFGTGSDPSYPHTASEPLKARAARRLRALTGTEFLEIQLHGFAGSTRAVFGHGHAHRYLAFSVREAPGLPRALFGRHAYQFSGLGLGV